MRARSLAAALVVAAACSNGATSDASSITFQLSAEAEEARIYEALVTSFENENPAVEVTMVPIADKDDHLAKLTTSFSAGNPPDVFLVNFREYSQYVALGAVEPIEDHLEDVSLEAYYDPPVEAFTFDGKLQCFPQNISNLVVYYNIDLFERAGLAHPARDWSWEDFRNYAQKLTTEEADGIGISPELIRLAPFVWSNGGDIVDDIDRPTRLTLDQPRAREAFAFVAEVARRFGPSEEELASADLETLFVRGKLGMLLESRKETPALREVAGLNWDVARLPRSGEPASILHSDAYCIAAGSDAVEAAAAFVRFAVGEQGQITTALGGRTVPSLETVATSDAFVDPLRPPKHARVFLQQIPYLRRTPVIPMWPEIEDLAEEIIHRAFYESGYSIDEALTDLETQTRPLFDEASG